MIERDEAVVSTAVAHTAAIESPRARCPVCGGASLQPVPRFARVLVRCRDCGVVCSSRVPTQAQLGAFYAGWPVHDTVPALTRKRYRELLGEFALYRRTGAILDVGCGSGHFLVEAQAAGWAAHGIELPDHLVDRVRSRGVTVSRDSSELPSGSFDVITAFEVVEHVLEPVAVMAEIARLVRPGGMVYVTTPNYNSLSRLVLGSRWGIARFPEHLLYFTPRTLRRVVGRSGLHVTKTLTTGVSVGALAVAVGAADEHRTDGRVLDEGVRTRMESSAALRTVKRLADRATSALGVGDAMKLYAERR